MAGDSKWMGHVTAWRSSGLTYAAYCADKGLSVSTLRYWAKRARSASGAPSEIRVAKVVAALADDDTPVVIEVGNARLAVRRGFDRDVLRDVLATLTSLSA